MLGRFLGRDFVISEVGEVEDGVGGWETGVDLIRERKGWRTWSVGSEEAKAKLLGLLSGGKAESE